MRYLYAIVLIHNTFTVALIKLSRMLGSSLFVACPSSHHSLSVLVTKLDQYGSTAPIQQTNGYLDAANMPKNQPAYQGKSDNKGDFTRYENHR